MSPFQWFTVIWTVITVALLPFAIFLWRTGRLQGKREESIDNQNRRSGDRIGDLTEVVKREIKRVELSSETKADLKALAALEERIMLRFDYIERRVTEYHMNSDKRFDAGSERMSKLTSKITVCVAEVKEEIAGVRERVRACEVTETKNR